MFARVHQVYSAGIQRAVHGDGCSVVAADIEHHALTVGIGCSRAHIVCGVTLYHIFPSEVGHKDRRQWRHRHASTQVETGIGVLVIASCGTVAAIVRVLLQAVDAVVGRHRCGISHQSCRTAAILLGQYHLLAPVANDVTHEGGTGAVGGVCGPRALLGELYQACLVKHLGHMQVRIPVAASGR